MFFSVFLAEVLHVCLSLSCLLSNQVFPSQAVVQPALLTFVERAVAPADSGPINTTCPVTTDEEIDPRFTAVYNGRTIGFCCRRCRTKFERDPEAYVAQIPQLINASLMATDQPIGEAGDEHAHEHGDMEASPEHAEHGEEDADHDHADAEKGEQAGRAHDHAHDHGGGDRSALIVWLGQFHPPLTHLPIGLLMGAALGEVLLILTKRESLRYAVNYCIWVGALGALGVATLGWFNAGFVLVDDDWVQLTHRWLGTATAVLALVTLIVLARTTRGEDPDRSRSGLRVALFTTVVLISAAGFFGGALVYGLNHYAWPTGG